MEDTVQTTELTDADREFLAEWNTAGTIMDCGCCDSYGNRI